VEFYLDQEAAADDQKDLLEDLLENIAPSIEGLVV
jgi:hypothetical protein